MLLCRPQRLSILLSLKFHNLVNDLAFFAWLFKRNFKVLGHYLVLQVPSFSRLVKLWVPLKTNGKDTSHAYACDVVGSFQDKWKRNFTDWLKEERKIHGDFKYWLCTAILTHKKYEHLRKTKEKSPFETSNPSIDIQWF